VKDRILAIVVCHNPKLTSLVGTLDALQGQVECIAVVDNASDNASALALKIQGLKRSDITLLTQTENYGLGAAHNVGIAYAKQLGYQYCLLLDQDSLPQAGMVQKLLHASNKKQQSALLSAVGVRYLNAHTGSDSFFLRFGKLKFQRHYCAECDLDGCVEADFLISSGCLVSLDAIDAIGDMDESLFIDHVDTEWFLRAKAKGFRAYGVCDAVMKHGLGEQTHRLNFGRPRNVPQHKPFRYYYMFRNSIALYRRGYASGWWKWNDLQRLCQITVMFGLVKAPRWQNLRMMCRGIIDGCRGVNGKMEQR